MGRPVPITMEHLNNAIKDSMEILQKYPILKEVHLSLSRFFETHVNAILAGIEEKDTIVSKSTTESLHVIFKAPIDGPISVKLTADWAPCLLPKINEPEPGFEVWMKKLPDGYPEIVQGGRKATHRMSTAMVVDIEKPVLPQMAHFRKVSAELMHAYCITTASEKSDEED